ncbi:PDZ domain-containing protein [Calidifontibacillus erzurumensis]|uniref:PDZ domain-containing protein n=1 Tax=Calidifontibacillus erzurumensis TaxID=2741433 RepID=UPI0035B508D5
MAEVWLLELLYGLGRFFLNPAFYILLLFAWLIGIQRTKKERKDFSVRIFPFNSEIVECILYGLISGVCVSIVLLGLGIVIPVGFIALTSVLTILVLLIMQPRLLSPAYVIGGAMLISLFVPNITVENQLLANWMTELEESPLFMMAVLLSLMLLAEGFLIVRKGHLQTSPALKKSKRGKQIGVHEAKKLWLVPVLLFIPGDALSSTLPWWPVIKTPFANFALLAVPFGIGFHQFIQASLPKEAIQLAGRRVLLLAIFVTILTVASYWLPILAVAASVVAIIGRELIALKQKVADMGSAPYFSNNKGLVILGIIPDSPADKMGLKVGEIITKVNGIQVKTAKQFYEALHVNRAFCKLDVLDYNGEVRFVQRALYENEHHELGLLFVNDENDWALTK